MMAGVVRGLQARVKLRIVGPRDGAHEVAAIVDSGFTGCLTLPPPIIASLELPRKGFLRGVMADGSERLLDLYGATVMWDRRRRQIDVAEADSIPLIGMALLNGYELTMQVRPGGKVAIKRLS